MKNRTDNTASKIDRISHVATGAVLLLTVCLLLLPPLASATEEAPTPEEHVFVLKDYKYVAEPDESGDDQLTGLVLCKTRCYALSVDYLTYTSPGGWYMQKVAATREMTVDLNHPFKEGQCLCVVDEYIVKVNDLYMVKPKDKAKGN